MERLLADCSRWTVDTELSPRGARRPSDWLLYCQPASDQYSSRANSQLCLARRFLHAPPFTLFCFHRPQDTERAIGSIICPRLSVLSVQHPGLKSRGQEVAIFRQTAANFQRRRWWVLLVSISPPVQQNGEFQLYKFCRGLPGKNIYRHT